MLIRRLGILSIVALVLLAACGDDDAGTLSVDVPDGATFCSVFSDQYDAAVDDAVPITDGAFGERIARIVAWAEVLVSLAPDEIAAQAEDNLKTQQAFAAIRSASDFIPGSNEMYAWAWDNCD